jgi:hypothetical protein
MVIGSSDLLGCNGFGCHTCDPESPHRRPDTQPTNFADTDMLSSSTFELSRDELDDFSAWLLAYSDIAGSWCRDAASWRSRSYIDRCDGRIATFIGNRSSNPRGRLLAVFNYATGF